MAISLEINLYLVLAFIGMLCACIYRYLSEHYTSLQKLGLPGPKPTWVFGNVLEFKNRNVLDVFAEWRQKYGDYYGFYEGFKTGVVLNTPEFAKEILNKHFDKFYTRTSYRPFVYYPDEQRLISIDGEHWKNQRSVLNKTLHSPGTLSQVVAKVRKASQKVLRSIDQERQTCIEGLNISKVIDTLTADTVMRVVLDMDDLQIEEHKDVITRYADESNYSASADNEITGLARLFPSLTPLLTFADKKHKAAHDEVVRVLRLYVAKIVAHENNNDGSCDEEPSMISHLCHCKILTRDIDGSLIRKSLDIDAIIAHVISFVSEINMTTTSSIQFMLYELARNQECQERVLEEMNTIFDQDEEITCSKLNKLEYFEQFFYETYRLHPVAPGISRVCAEDCKINGVNFRKGMVVRMMTAPIYQDEKIFPNPQHFDPERFSKENKDARHQYTFLPWGQGPRMCPGFKLAPIIIKTVIVTILQQYSIHTADNTEIPLQHALRPSLCAKNDIHITLKPRKTTAL